MDGEYRVDDGDFVNGNTLIDAIEISDLSDTEKNWLIQMREEEKLARDVYTVLGQKWWTQIFSNIAWSEQTHTDAVKNLLDRYDITDPVSDDTMGVFESAEMTDLYNTLTQQGSTSLLDALIVGATIEDLDIYDLDVLLADTDNADIRIVYANLQRGSRNHIRAFTRQIEKNGGAYEAQYISSEDYAAILASDQERGGNEGDHKKNGSGDF